MDPKQSQLENEKLENASSDEIRGEIRGTRREMDETLDEIGQRLHPRHLLDDLLDVFRGSGRGSEVGQRAARTSRRLGRSIAREVKVHPLPALVAGTGIVWWMIDAFAGDEEEFEPYGYPPGSQPEQRPSYGTETGTGSAYSPGHGGESGMAGVASRAGDKAGETSAAGTKVSEVASAIGEKISDAGEAASSAAHAGWKSIRDRGSAVRRYSEREGRVVSRKTGVARERLREASDEYPLVVGGACLAAGVLAGLLLPRTAQEDEWVGEAADELKDEVRTRGEEALQRGKAAVAETAASAMDEAEKRGLSPENLASKAGRIVSEAVEAGKASAEKEGMTPSDLQEDARAVAERTKETAREKAQESTGAAGH